jgi:hypothetical protein
VASAPHETLRAILELARWAPSGDNTQPWRFEIAGDDDLVVHGFDTREHCVYDLDGHASQLAVGALLETACIAASVHGLRATVTRRAQSTETRPVFDVRLARDAGIEPSPLASAIETRSVQRRALSTRPLMDEAREALSASLPAPYSLLWIEGLRERFRMARTLFASARIRLTIAEAYETHRRVIDWGARFSEDRIPDQAVGLDPVTVRLMRWAMQDWRRIRFMNRYLAGTVLPRLQLDLLPGLACGAHVLILAQRPAASLDEYVAAGAAVQRFWLRATTLGLQHQPEMTPLIFARYAREGRRFSAAAEAMDAAREVRRRLEAQVGPGALARAVWMGRIGEGTPATARSLRLPLEKLMAG